MVQINLLPKQKQGHRCRKQTLTRKESGVGGGINWETGIDKYTLLYIKCVCVCVCVCARAYTLSCSGVSDFLPPHGL